MTILFYSEKWCIGDFNHMNKLRYMICTTINAVMLLYSVIAMVS